MKVFFITRFSIFDSKFRGFRLSSYYSESEYAKRLFDSARMDHKFDAFENITLPSIIGQSYDEWFWLIYTSDRLPEIYIQRLKKSISNHLKINIISVKDFKEFFEKNNTYDYQTNFATVRLDDDDGLSKYFVENVQQYRTSVGKIISFTDGRKVKCVKGKVLIGDKISEKNNAQGMVGIGLKIYNCGSHSDVDLRFNVIYDSTPDMYFVDCSPFADTKRSFSYWGRITTKLSRMLFIAMHHPKELRQEIVNPIKKLWNRKCS